MNISFTQNFRLHGQHTFKQMIQSPINYNYDTAGGKALYCAEFKLLHDIIHHGLISDYQLNLCMQNTFEQKLY